MNQVSTEIRDRALVFFDGTFKPISRAQEAVLFSPQASQAGMARIDGDVITLKAVSRVTDLQDFYAQHPDKRPAQKIPLYSTKEYAEKTFSGTWKENRNVQALKSMIRGMENYINSPRYQGTQAPHELLAKMKQKLAEV